MMLRRRSYLVEKIEPVIRDVANLIKVDKKNVADSEKKLGQILAPLAKLDDSVGRSVFREAFFNLSNRVEYFEIIDALGSVIEHIKKYNKWIVHFEGSLKLSRSLNETRSAYAYHIKSISDAEDEIRRYSEVFNGISELGASGIKDGEQILINNEENPKMLAPILEIPKIINKFLSRLDYSKKRIEATLSFTPNYSKGDFDLPVSVEKTERLYHASVDARQLYQNGFSKKIPKEGGLGGGEVGEKVSFTYDLRVAKEISRSLKEVIMIARGELTAGDIYDWAKREGIYDKVYKQFMYGGNVPKGHTTGTRRMMHRNPITKRVHTVVAADEKIDNKKESFLRKKKVKSWLSDYRPIHTFDLYKKYLFFSKRYDPLYVFIDEKKFLTMMMHKNPRNVGIVVAKVDMTGAEENHFYAMGEIRVTPDKIIKVEKFIG